MMYEYKKVGNKEVINADEFKFLIRPMSHKQAHGLFIVHENGHEQLLVQKWKVNECKEWLHSHFIGEKGTSFNIEVREGTIVKDENGLLHLEE